MRTPLTAATTSFVLAAACFAGLDVAVYLLGSHTTGALGPGAGLVLRLTCDLALLAFGRAPAAVLAVMVAGSATLQVSELIAPGLLVASPSLTGDPLTLAPIGAVIFAAVVLRPGPAEWVLIGLLTLLATRPWAPSWATIPLGLLLTVFPVVLARWVTARRSLLAALRARAERAAEQARAEERARLAGEMHDVVTHRVSLMVLQAGALEVGTVDPAVRTAAVAISTAGRQALDELRDLVGVFGERDGSSPSVGPAQPVGDVTELVDASIAAGVPVRLDRTGDPDALPPAVLRTAHRVVQEALTNVHKHAPGGQVTVAVHYAADGVTVAVSNTAATAHAPLAPSGSGRGLRGLRERVELLGGDLDAGPRDGGFVVTARVPS